MDHSIPELCHGLQAILSRRISASEMSLRSLLLSLSPAPPADAPTPIGWISLDLWIAYLFSLRHSAAPFPQGYIPVEAHCYWVGPVGPAAAGPQFRPCSPAACSHSSSNSVSSSTPGGTIVVLLGCLSGLCSVQAAMPAQYPRSDDAPTSKEAARVRKTRSLDQSYAGGRFVPCTRSMAPALPHSHRHRTNAPAS